MIIESILNVFKSLIFKFTSWLDIPSLTDYVDGFNTAVSFVETILESSKSLINLFLPWDIVRFGLPILIVILNIENIYNFFMWLIKKIPMLNVK